MSSSCALCFLLSVKKQKHDFHGLFRRPSKTVKDSQNAKRWTKVTKELFADYVREKKLREPKVFFSRLEINYKFHLLSTPFFSFNV